MQIKLNAISIGIIGLLLFIIIYFYLYIKLVGEMALAFDPNWTFVRGINKNKHKHIHLYLSRKKQENVARVINLQTMGWLRTNQSK